MEKGGAISFDKEAFEYNGKGKVVPFHALKITDENSNDYRVQCP